MNKLFLATSFSGHVDHVTGKVHADYRQKVEGVIGALRTTGDFIVFCAVEHENWIIASDIPPEVGVEKALAEIDSADIFLAMPPADMISAGLQYEVGYADAKGKKVIVATETGDELTYFNQGATRLGRIAHIQYDSPADLVAQVKSL
jgi:hypothetical protein